MKRPEFETDCERSSKVCLKNVKKTTAVLQP